MTKTIYMLCFVLLAWNNVYADVQKESVKTSTSKKNDPIIKNNNLNTKGEKIKTGFYSVFALGLCHNSLSGNVSEITDGKESNKQKLILNKNHPTLRLSIGYDKNFGPLILGVDAGVRFNPNSEIEYKKESEINIANVSYGLEYSGFAKFGVAIGRMQLCGKIGSELSRANYDWKLSNSHKEEKSYFGRFAWGGTLEVRISENIMLQVDFVKNNKSTQDKLNVPDKKNKVSDTAVDSYKISLGCGYRF